MMYFIEINIDRHIYVIFNLTAPLVYKANSPYNVNNPLY